MQPTLAQRLEELGYDAVHPRNLGRLGAADHTVFARAIADDRVIVTENASDFRALAAGVDIHPGLIVLPSHPAAIAATLAFLARGSFRGGATSCGRGG